MGFPKQAVQPSARNMFPVVLLSLIGACSAAPQFGYGYPGAYQQYPVYPVYPRYGGAYPVYPIYPAETAASSRGIFTLPSFQTATSGTVEFQQNPFTGDNSIYKIYLNGPTAGTKYSIGLAATCDSSAAVTALGNDVTAPAFLVNGFYVKGTSTTFNVDGNGTPATAKGQFLIVKETSSGAVVGCTDAAIA